MSTILHWLRLIASRLAYTGQRRGGGGGQAVPELHHEWLPPTLPPVRTYPVAEVARDYGWGRVSRWELETWALVMRWRDELDGRLDRLAWGGGHIAHRDLATGLTAWTPLAAPAVRP